MIERKGHGVLVVVGEGTHKNKNGSYSCMWENRQEFKVNTAKEGRALAKKLIGKNKSVIVRPRYNEITKQRGTFFREWRSFNGKPLKEVVWKTP
jgi:hypothetical protein